MKTQNERGSKMVVEEKKEQGSNYMKVRREGGSVAVTVGKRIPLDWKLVELSTVSESDDAVVIRFKKVG